MNRVVAAVVATLVLAPAAQAAPPPEHRADPSLTTYVKRVGPYTVGSYETLQKATHPVAPEVPGAIVGMDARLVDKRGAVIPQHIVMLHHLVFTNGGPADKRRDPGCPHKRPASASGAPARNYARSRSRPATATRRNPRTSGARC